MNEPAKKDCETPTPHAPQEKDVESGTVYSSGESGKNSPISSSNENDATIPPSPRPSLAPSTVNTGKDDATIPPRRSPSDPDNNDATVPPKSASTKGSVLDGQSVFGAHGGMPESQRSWCNVDASQSFGDYELIQEIARGGMGVVFKARQRKLNRFVALKMILSGQLASTDDVQRFYAEAEAAANLDHPGIVSIYEVGQWEGQHFFSMAFIEGTSLAAKIKDGPLPPKEAAKFARQITDAVQYAHENGVIHRDLKPANVLLDKFGHPKVMDFGLAKKTSGDSQITQAGEILGTPSYMPPEQAEGRIEDIGPGADIYSLGAILYCLLTGRPPFQAATSMDTLMQVIEKEPVSPRQVNGEVPKDLETICLKCLQKPIARRYPSARELGEDLQRFLDGRPILARPVGRIERTVRWCKRNPVVAGLIGSIAILLLGVATNQTLTAQRERGLRDVAVLATKSAEENAQESKQRLVRQFVANGVRLMDDHDITGSLPWFVEALRLDHEHENIHRYRIANVLDQCPMPSQVWYHEGRVHHVTFDHAGKRLISCSEDHFARIWNVESGAKLAELPHAKGVVFAAVSPDDRFIVTASTDATAQVWDMSNGTRHGPALKHTKPVTSAIFSPDGKWVLTTSEDATARLWDAESGRPIFEPFQHALPLLRAAFSPDGTLVATAGGTQQKAFFGAPESRIWSTRTGKELHRLTHEGCVMSVQFSPDGSSLATSTDNFIAMVWDPKTGKNLFPPIRDEDIIHQIAYSPDGTKVATTSDFGHIRIWNAKTGEVITSRLRQNGRVRNIAFTPDGRRIASGSQDGTVFVWDATTGDCVVRNLVVSGHVDWLDCDPTGTRIAVACRDGTARIWDITATEPALNQINYPGRINHIAYNSDGSKLVIRGYDGSAQVWDSATKKPITPVLFHKKVIRSMMFAPHSEKLLTGSEDGTAQVWDLTTGKPAGPPIKGGKQVGCAVFSPDENWIVTSSWEDKNDTEVKIWDAKTQELNGTLTGHKDAVFRLQFSHDGSRLATMSRDQSVCIWDFVHRKQLTPFIQHGNPLTYFEFSPNDDYLATACGEPLLEGGGFARVWNAQTGEPASPQVKHNNGVSCVSFSQDGRRILTGSYDNTGRVWDALTAQPLTPALKHTAQLNTAVFSPDGKLILTGSTDTTARLWDAETGEAVSPPFRHSAWCLLALFNSDGRSFLTRSVDNTARIFSIPYEIRPIEDLTRIGQVISGVQIYSSGDSAKLTPQEYKEQRKSVVSKYQNSFAGSKEKMIAFHRREATECGYDRMWFAKSRHVRSLVELDSSKPAWNFELGRCYAEYGDYKKAFDEFAIAEKKGYVNPLVDFYRVLGALVANDPKAYGESCRRMVERFTVKTDPQVLYDQLLLLTAAPNEVAGSAKVRELCDALLKLGPEDHSILSLIAGIEFRAGKPEQAKARMLKALPIEDGIYDGFDWLILSLIESQLGKKAEAKTWFEKGSDWIDRESGERTRGVQGRNLFWERKLHFNMLRNEARQALAKAGP